MILQNLLNQRKIKPHNTSAQEICDLFMLVERDIKDARIKELSVDRRFATAYNACLQLSTIIMYAGGYRCGSSDHHFITFQFLKTLKNSKFTDFADYFDYCRTERNIIDYRKMGTTSEAEVKDILENLEKFFKLVMNWLGKKHKKLMP